MKSQTTLNAHEREVLSDVVKKLKTEFGAEQVMLYGSAARGEMDRESDIDLLAVLPSVSPSMLLIIRRFLKAGKATLWCIAGSSARSSARNARN